MEAHREDDDKISWNTSCVFEFGVSCKRHRLLDINRRHLSA